MSTTCWAADVGDGLAPAEMMMARARPRPGDRIECCVRPGYFRGNRDYACKHEDGCLHRKAEEHRPPAWDPPPEAFARSRKRDPKRRLGPVEPLVGPGWSCLPEPRKPGASKRTPARGKGRKSR